VLALTASSLRPSEVLFVRIWKKRDVARSNCALGGNNCGGDSRNRKYVKVKPNCHNKGLLDPRLWAVSVAFSSACTSRVHASEYDKLRNFMFSLTRGAERLPNATACHWRIHYPTPPDDIDVRRLNNCVRIIFFSIILPLLFFFFFFNPTLRVYFILTTYHILDFVSYFRLRIFSDRIKNT
jgi:hypothetical protein